MAFLLLQSGGHLELQAGGDLLLQAVDSSLNATGAGGGGYTIAEHVGATLPPLRKKPLEASANFTAYGYCFASPDVLVGVAMRSTPARTRSRVEVAVRQQSGTAMQTRAKLTAAARIVVPNDDALVAFLLGL